MSITLTMPIIFFTYLSFVRTYRGRLCKTFVHTTIISLPSGAWLPENPKYILSPCPYYKYTSLASLSNGPLSEPRSEPYIIINHAVGSRI